MQGAEAVARYLAHVRHEKRLAARTLALYTLDLEKLQQFARQSGVDLLQVQHAHIRRWVVQMHGAGRSARGIALILSGWRGFYTWLARQGLVATNPVQGVRAPKAAKPLPKALGVDEAVQFASYEKDSNKVNGDAALRPKTPRNAALDQLLECRDHAMVELLYSSGLRVGELVGLDAQGSAAGQSAGHGWVDLTEAQAHVCGKGGKWRSVPVGRYALDALQRWLALRSAWVAVGSRSTSALFIGRNGTRLSAQSVWSRLQQRSREAGMATPVHPHMLRHSFASHVLQSSADLRAVQELLGHAQISTTQVYTRLDFQHLARAYDAAHPRAKLKKTTP